jgi:hypothetical protein
MGKSKNQLIHNKKRFIRSRKGGKIHTVTITLPKVTTNGLSGEEKDIALNIARATQKRHFKWTSGRQYLSSRNFAVALFKSNGKTKRIKAVSGTNKYPTALTEQDSETLPKHNDIGVASSNWAPPLEKQIWTTRGGGVPRHADTEVKILGQVFGETKKKTTGKIYLFTPRKPCSSCQNVMSEFSSQRPNIQLHVYHGEANNKKFNMLKPWTVSKWEHK